MYPFGPGILKILQHFKGKHLPGNKGGVDLFEFYTGRLEHVYIYIIILYYMVKENRHFTLRGYVPPVKPIP